MTFLSSTLPEHLVDMQVGPAAIIALLGYCVVFFGIVLLMCVMIVMGKVFVAKANKEKAAKALKTEAPKAAAAPAPAPAAEPVAPVIPEAPGTAGQLKLHDVEPKTAAMLMAIVADKLGKPIKEVK